MIFDEFISMMKKEEENGKYKSSDINLDAIKEINKIAHEIGLEKMNYEHPVHSAWKSLGNFPLNGYK